MKKADITVVINTSNEQNNIVEAIDSAKFLTRNILVVDMESADKTVFLAKKNGAKILSFPKKNYVEPARTFGIKKSVSDWVFILDADERITKKLALEIQSMIINRNEKATNFKITRKNIFAGRKWLQYGGWWPDYQTRLINKKHFIDWPNQIHSSPRIKGKTGLLKNPLIHFFHNDLESMVKKTVVFEDIESDLLHQAGRTASTSIFFRKYLAELFKRMIKKAGFLDGPVGIIESLYQAYSKTITYLYLYEKNSGL